MTSTLVSESGLHTGRNNPNRLNQQVVIVPILLSRTDLSGELAVAKSLKILVLGSAHLSLRRIIVNSIFLLHPYLELATGTGIGISSLYGIVDKG